MIADAQFSFTLRAILICIHFYPFYCYIPSRPFGVLNFLVVFLPRYHELIAGKDNSLNPTA